MLPHKSTMLARRARPMPKVTTVAAATVLNTCTTICLLLEQHRCACHTWRLHMRAAVCQPAPQQDVAATPTPTRWLFNLPAPPHPQWHSNPRNSRRGVWICCPSMMIRHQDSSNGGRRAAGVSRIASCPPCVLLHAPCAQGICVAQVPHPPSPCQGCAHELYVTKWPRPVDEGRG